MNPLNSFRPELACSSARRYSRTIVCLSLSILFFAIFLSWLPRKQAHAFGRLAINLPEGEFTLPESKAGSPYEFQFQTEGGLAPLRWSVISGALPSGLRLEANGKLLGTPTQAAGQPFAFTV